MFRPRGARQGTVQESREIPAIECAVLGLILAFISHRDTTVSPPPPSLILPSLLEYGVRSKDPFLTPAKSDGQVRLPAGRHASDDLKGELADLSRARDDAEPGRGTATRQSASDAGPWWVVVVSPQREERGERREERGEWRVEREERQASSRAWVEASRPASPALPSWAFPGQGSRAQGTRAKPAAREIRSRRARGATEACQNMLLLPHGASLERGTATVRHGLRAVGPIPERLGGVWEDATGAKGGGGRPARARLPGGRVPSHRPRPRVGTRPLGRRALAEPTADLTVRPTGESDGRICKFGGPGRVAVRPPTLCPPTEGTGTSTARPGPHARKPTDNNPSPLIHAPSASGGTQRRLSIMRDTCSALLAAELYLAARRAFF
ncbi:unnamed protein product [Diplocarpon coronariae]